MPHPLDEDIERLTPAQLDAMRCPVCRGMLVRPCAPGSKGLVCPSSGHTGLVREIDVQERFLAVSPKSFQQFDPRRNEYAWNYALKRAEEHWQSPAALKRALELQKKRKGKKP